MSRGVCLVVLLVALVGVGVGVGVGAVLAGQEVVLGVITKVTQASQATGPCGRDWTR